MLNPRNRIYEALIYNVAVRKPFFRSISKSTGMASKLKTTVSDFSRYPAQSAHSREKYFLCGQQVGFWAWAIVQENILLALDLEYPIATDITPTVKANTSRDPLSRLL